MPDAERGARAVSGDVHVGPDDERRECRATSRWDRTRRRGASGRSRSRPIAGTSSLRGNDMRFVLRAPGGEILNSTYFSVETIIGVRRHTGSTHACAAWATDMGLGCASGAPSAARAPGRTIERYFARTIPGRRWVRLIHRLLMPAPSSRCSCVCASLFRARSGACGAGAAASTARARQAADRVARRVGGARPPVAGRADQICTRLQRTTARSRRAGASAFGVSYWESRFRDGVVQAFVDSLKKSVTRADGARGAVADHGVRRHVRRWTCAIRRRRRAARSSHISASASPRT